MLDEPVKLNISTCSDTELIAFIHQTHSLAMQASEELVRRAQKLASQSFTPCEIAGAENVAIANGHKLSEQELQNINEDKFDIILDMTTNSLRFRQFPSRHSELVKAVLEGIGQRRMEILVYLLEHPTRFISVENVSNLANQCAIVESGALAKTISIFRKTLGHSYIITESSLGNPNCVYKLNPQWNYLVIKDKKSTKSHR
jgi:hypothetical protein